MNYLPSGNNNSAGIGCGLQFKGTRWGQFRKIHIWNKFHCLWKNFFIKVIDEICIKRKSTDAVDDVAVRQVLQWRGARKAKKPKALQVTADDSRRQGYIQMGEVYLRTATPQVQAHHKRITGIDKDISTFWTDKGTYERWQGHSNGTGLTPGIKHPEGNC